MKNNILFFLLPLFVSVTPLWAAENPAAAGEQTSAAERAGLWRKFSEIRAQGNKAASVRDWTEVRSCVDRAAALFDRIGAIKPMDQREMNDFTWCFTVFQPDRKANKDVLRGYYELLIPKASGDVKADWISRCAALLTEQKMEKADDIRAFRDKRYAVPGLSEGKLLSFLLEDKRLEEADAIIRKRLDAAPDSAEKLKQLQFAVTSFSGRGVYGSVFARKYYPELLKLTTDPAAKCALLTRWADYAEENALLPDEEIAKLRASRYTIPNLPAKAKVTAYLADISATLDSDEIPALRDKALAAAGEAPSLRYEVIALLTGTAHPVKARLKISELTWIPEFFMKEITSDREFTRSQYADLVRRYVRNFRFGRWQQMEKELLSLLDRAQKNFRMQQTVWKTAADKLDAALKTPGGKDVNALRQQTAEEFARLRDRAGRVRDMMTILADYYHTNALRHYDSPDPVMLGREKEMIRRSIDFNLSCTFEPESLFLAASGEFHFAEIAFSQCDYAEVRRCAERNKTYLKSAEEAGKTAKQDRGARRIAEIATRYQYLLGASAFEEENYAEAIAILTPLVRTGGRHYGTDRNSDPRTNIFRCLLMSHLALDDYEGALKYETKFLETSPWFMQSRLREALGDVHKRAEAAGKKK